MTPDARFVIACPSCRGRIAAVIARAGRVGCCPLCAATLVVPAAASAPPAPERTSPAPTSPAMPSTAAPVDAFSIEAAAMPPQAAAGDPALAFREPVQTVAAGGRAVELRRLTEEERRNRRARRNLLLLLVGGGLLITLTVAFGYRPAR